MTFEMVSVGTIKKLGGKVVGEPVNFYGEPVNPMVLNQHDFYIQTDSLSLFPCREAAIWY